ncbi:sigma factor-like helix-turn-helix DNA-binding protein [Arenimonas sp.]|uniref:sigma factor-like helix-turn-helix DNA-binding protein n=1 Tax=Arenimonas sp. TaxID=1872635 RepID=UPI0035B31B7D
MRAPDASRFCPEPGYLRSLAVWCGLTHAEIAKRLGVSIRTVERHLTDNPSAAGVHGYLLQYGMEMLFIHKAATTATLRRRAARLAPGGRRPKCHGGVSE